jgi:acetyltransferase-like isoleucine patch superfamily enzyme
MNYIFHGIAVLVGAAQKATDMIYHITSSFGVVPARSLRTKYILAILIGALLTPLAWVFADERQYDDVYTVEEIIITEHVIAPRVAPRVAPRSHGSYVIVGPKVVGRTVTVARPVPVGYPVMVGHPVSTGYPVVIGNPATIGQSANIARAVDIGHAVAIGNATSIGSAVSIGYAVEIGRAVEVARPVEVAHAVEFHRPNKPDNSVASNLAQLRRILAN